MCTYRQALRYNRIFSNNEKFDQRCNDLEKWLMERGYSERLARTQILKEEINLGIAVLNKGIPEPQRVNLLLASLTTQCFRMSEVYCTNFKFC